MYTLRLILFLLAASMISGCVASECKEKNIGYVLPGTRTAVVGVYLGNDGIPQETVKEVVVNPGQKVLYAGPDEFSIVFKKQKTPNGKVENKSVRGVVLIEIPEDIFKQKQFIEEFRRHNELVFDYGIRVNGRELDPPIRVVPPTDDQK